MVSVSPRLPTLQSSCFQRALLSLLDGELFSRAIQFPDILLCLFKTDSLERAQYLKYFKNTENAIASLLSQAFFLISNLPLWSVFYSLLYSLCPRQMKQLAWKRSNSVCQNNIYFYISNEKKGELKENINQSVSEVLEEEIPEMWNCEWSLIRDAQMPTYKPTRYFILYTVLYKRRQGEKAKQKGYNRPSCC